MSKSIMILKNKYEKGPYLIHFRYWLDAKFKQGSTLKVQLGDQHPKIYKNYVPGDRLVLFAICREEQLPSCLITYNQQELNLNLNNYQASVGKQLGINLEKCKINFMLEILDDTNEIANRYSSDRMPEQQRYQYNESINDLIRSEQQFLSVFQRDKQVELVKMAQRMQKQREMQLTQEIMSVKSFEFSLKKCLIIFVLFMIIGYLMSEPEHSYRQDGKKHKKNKKKSGNKKTKTQK